MRTYIFAWRYGIQSVITFKEHRAMNTAHLHFIQPGALMRLICTSTFYTRKKYARAFLFSMSTWFSPRIFLKYLRKRTG